jgi:hypothetical protein
LIVSQIQESMVGIRRRSSRNYPPPVY